MVKQKKHKSLSHPEQVSRVRKFFSGKRLVEWYSKGLFWLIGAFVPCVWSIARYSTGIRLGIHTYVAPTSLFWYTVFGCCLLTSFPLSIMKSLSSSLRFPCSEQIPLSLPIRWRPRTQSCCP